MHFRWTEIPRPIVALFITSIVALAISLPKPVQANPISGLDGNGINDACNAAGCSVVSEQLSTSHGNDLVILIAECLQCQVTDSAGLTYNLRASFRGPSFGTLSEYYADARAPLISDDVSVSVSLNCSCDGAFMHVFAVHGYRHDPFEMATPTFVDCGTADFDSIPCSGSLTTSRPDFLVSFVSTFVAYCDTPPGWTHLGGLGAWIGSAYLIQANAGTTSVSYSCTHLLDTGGFTYGAEVLMIDAITLNVEP